MCEATTIIALAGLAMTAYGTNENRKSQDAQIRYNSKVAANEAKKVQNKGVDDENQFRLQTAQLRKEQEAQFGAANVQLGSGSAADILSDTDMFGEVDALNIRSNTADEVESLGMNAEASRLRGVNQKSADSIRGFSSVLSGAGSVSSKWYAKQGTSQAYATS